MRTAKYRPSAALLDALGRRLGRRTLDRWPGQHWIVVPVPPDLGRRRRRGVDHAARLASGVTAALGRHATTLEALSRRRRTAPQSRVPWKRREANVHAAIALRPGIEARLRGAHVLLVDDVTTSGATLRACRATLLGGGAASVRAAVVARAR